MSQKYSKSKTEKMPLTNNIVKNIYIIVNTKKSQKIHKLLILVRIYQF